MKSVDTPILPSQPRIASAINSGPLSERMCCGTPRSTMTDASTPITSSAMIDRAACVHRHSRVYSSTIARTFTCRPSSVRSKRRSYDQA